MATQMTNKERMLNVLAGKPVDRVPVGFWFHFLPDELGVDAVADPSQARAVVEGHARYIGAFHPDFVKIMSDGFFQYPAAGGAAPRSERDLTVYRRIDASHPWIQAQVALVREVVAMQKDTMYFYNIFSPLTTLRFALGRETLESFFARDFIAVGSALHGIAEGLACLATEVIRSGGADGVYLSVQDPDPEKIDERIAGMLLKSMESIILDAVKAAGGKSILHICGYEGAKNRLSLFKDYEADAFNWGTHVEGVPLAEGKVLFGGKAVIGGFANPPGCLLETGAKEAIQQETRALLKAAGRVGVALGADCTIPRGTPLEHLEWVREAAASASL